MNINKNESASKMKSLFIIINAGHAHELLELLREAGATGATILNTRGEEGKHESFMGITMDSEKELIVCVAEEATAEKAIKLIGEKMGVNTPVHGVCFTIPIDNLVGINIPLNKQEGKKE